MNLLIKEFSELKNRFLVLALLIILMGYFILAYYDFFLSLIDINSIREGLAAFPLSRYMDTAALIEQLNLMLNDMDFYLWSQWMGKNLTSITISESRGIPILYPKDTTLIENPLMDCSPYRLINFSLNSREEVFEVSITTLA
jgi:hypothetical protein